MNQYTSSQFLELLNDNKITPYNCYGLDLDYTQYFSIDHYLKNPNDNFEVNQKLNTILIDIEVYSNNNGKFPIPSVAKCPISAITIYSTEEQIYKSYILLMHSNINKFPSKDQLPQLINEFKKILIEEEYFKESDNEQIEIFVYTNELEMIKACWSEVRRIDPATLSGWNFSLFDLPYIYFRLGNLLNKNESEVGKILSIFGLVKINKMGEDYIVSIPEMPVADLLYLYKPREDQGLNMGEKQASYSLDYIAEAELDLKKKEYKSEGMSLDTFYETDPVNFLLYNIIDVILVKKLNNKLKHIDSFNLLRRLMKTSFSGALRGSSILFDTYVNYELNRQNKFVRFGIVEENTNAISEDQLTSVYIPKSMNKTIKEVNRNEYQKITGRFFGAYVKQSTAQIITSKDGIISDLDATSLYPSLINQLNISFDTFYGKIIDPFTYKVLGLIKKALNTKTKLPDQVYTNIWDLTVKYIEKLKPQNKTEYAQYCYLVTAYLLRKLEKSNIHFDDLCNPKTMQNYIYLKKYLLPLMDLIDAMHTNSKDYNSFCGEYLINNTKFDSEFIQKYGPYIIDPTTGDVTPKIYIIEDILQPNLKINMVSIHDFEKYLKEKQLILSLSGCLFKKHEVQPGLFIDFLKNLKQLRTNYEKQKNNFDENSLEFSFYDMRQKAIKVSMNTTLNKSRVTC
jgi:DNA polymerase elongation subunit (family B)